MDYIILLELAGKVEADLGEIVLCHGEHKLGVGKEYIASFTVESHELMFAFLEGLECGRIIAFYPTGLVHRHWLPTALRSIFVQQAVLYDFELELAHSADDLTAIELMHKELSDTLVHKLLYTLFELF